MIKIKNGIFCFSISFMIIMILLTIVTLINIRNNKYSDCYPLKNDYIKDFESLKERGDQISNIECKNSIIKSIESSENLFFSKPMTVSEIRNILDKNVFLNEFKNLTNNCNIDENEKVVLNSKILAVTLFYEVFLGEYRENYKLVLNISNDDVVEEVSVISSGLRAAKKNEIEIINNIIEVVLNEK